MIVGIEREFPFSGLKINNGTLQVGAEVQFTDGPFVQVLRIPMRSGNDAFECEIPLVEGRFTAVLPRYDTPPRRVPWILW